jgi:hypothetical protein
VDQYKVRISKWFYLPNFVDKALGKVRNQPYRAIMTYLGIMKGVDRTEDNGPLLHLDLLDAVEG